jgi:phage terminase large subunit-like protein
MAETVIRAADPSANYVEVRATRGKAVRAEPISALYEQDKVRHVGRFPQLEDQTENFSTAGYMGDKSPDRADAMVWALTNLMVDEDDFDMVHLSQGVWAALNVEFRKCR